MDLSVLFSLICGLKLVLKVAPEVHLVSRDLLEYLLGHALGANPPSQNGSEINLLGLLLSDLLFPMFLGVRSVL